MGRKRTDPAWQALRDQLWSRSQGFCEITGVRLDREGFDAHHRRPKGIGGTYREMTDTLPNLLALTPAVHNGGPRSVHGLPSWSRPRGYLLPHHIDDDVMAAEPLLYRGRDWVVLTDDGDFVPLSARSQRYLWRKLETAQGMIPATRPRGSQYR